MASVKNFKKEINNVLSDIIEECYICQLISDDKIAAKADKIIDEAIATFDTLIAKLNDNSVENKKKYFQTLNADLKSKATDLLGKIEKLSA